MFGSQSIGVAGVNIKFKSNQKNKLNRGGRKNTGYWSLDNINGKRYFKHIFILCTP